MKSSIMHNDEATAQVSGTYELLDSGDYQKLERVGRYTVVRPATVAAYPKKRPELWAQVDGVYERSETGGGRWNWRGTVPDEFWIRYHDFTIKIRFTPFGHLGLFAEQLANWQAIQRAARVMPPESEALNLFAYSGVSTLACLSAGLAVCHLDASKGMVDWARENARGSGLAGGRVRWIVEDVAKFVMREVKRGRPYNALILDPPTFGRGNKGEVWKIEKDLPELLDQLMELCAGRPDLIVLTCHSTGYSPLTLRRLLATRLRDTDGVFETGELTIPETAGEIYPSGSSCVYRSARVQAALSGV